MNRPLVSIIIPSTNHGERLFESIDGVLSQDYSQVELLVADGGSTDGTVEWLAGRRGQDKRLGYFTLPGKGEAALASHALGRARGTVVACLRPGDRYAPGAIGRAVEKLQANPDYLMVYGRGEYFDNAGNRVDGYAALLPETPKGEAANGRLFCGASVFFKRSLYALLGGMEEGGGFGYWLKAFIEFPSRIGFIDAAQAYSRAYDEAAGRAMVLESLDILTRHLGAAPVERLLKMDGDLPRPGLEDLRAHIAMIEAAACGYRVGQDSGGLPAGIAVMQPSVSGPETASRIRPDELIHRYALSEHVRFADDYFKGRESHLYLYQKPFFHPRDCAPSLSNLGQLFAGANLDKGMRVMDFASGSCWLSRILVQLGCIVTSCDASKIALDIGKELFRKYPPIADEFTMPEFYVFDGSHLDFPDKSFDRILVNDAFHHVPNIAGVLAEFFRVLKDDGMVCMSEPGRFHSQTEASQYEMKEFNVIENDLVLEDLWREAQAIGFESIQICPVLRQPYLGIEDYLNCIRGRVPAKVVRGLVGDTVNHSIFFLHKSSTTDVQQLITEREKFDEAWYRARHPDVDAAVAAGLFGSGWEHYRRCGMAEGRGAKKLAGQC